MELTIKFLKNNGITINKKQVGSKITLSAIHQHGEIFSNLLIGLITKLFLKTSSINTISAKDGTFSIDITRK